MATKVSKQHLISAFLVLTLVCLFIMIQEYGPLLGAGSTSEPGPIEDAQAASRAAQIAVTWVVETYGVPATALIVSSEQPSSYPELGRSFYLVIVNDTRPGQHAYKVLVDRNTGEVTEDIHGLELRAQQAYMETHGKLHPSLYDRLQTIGDSETLTVVIWVATSAAAETPNPEAILEAKYPEVKAALEQGRTFEDVDDPELAREIRSEWVALVEAQMAQRVAPVADALAAAGVKPLVAGGAAPIVIAQMQKRLILEIAQRPDVGTIYLSGTYSTSMNTSVPETLAPVSWARSMTGVGASIAHVDVSNVDFSAPAGACFPYNCFSYHGNTFNQQVPVDDHATLCASIMASNHTVYRGMAYNAAVHSGGIGENGGDEQFYVSLGWALLQQGADVVNISMSSRSSCQYYPSVLDIGDRFVDFYARSANRLIVVSAGNLNGDCGARVQTPAKGWNALTVGAYKDTYPGVIAVYSAFMNPTPGIEKPEVVAPGSEITGIVQNGGLPAGTPPSGTSFSAPHVAGLSLLAINRSSLLRTAPLANRALILASATNNIEGPRNDYGGTADGLDGAGAINAAWADTIAQGYVSLGGTCSGSCWGQWSFNLSTFPEHTNQVVYFSANEGQLERAAIAWYSHPDCFAYYACTNDELLIDLDLHVECCNDSNYDRQVAYSTSYYNANEVVEFAAPRAGIYRLRIYKANDDETYTTFAQARLGFAILGLNALYMP